MALHGSMRVNAQIIGYWSARRTELLTEGTEVYEYECEVEWSTLDGKPQYREFTVKHSYAAGSLILASKVLAVAAMLPEE